MADDKGVQAWAQAVLTRLAEQQKTQRWLGVQTAAEEGRASSYGQGTIGDWLKTGPPKPAQAFAIERALGEKPGALSRLLGYLPLDAKPALTPEAAIEADGSLSPAGKEYVLGVLRLTRKRGV